MKNEEIRKTWEKLCALTRGDRWKMWLYVRECKRNEVEPMEFLANSAATTYEELMGSLPEIENEGETR